MRVWGYQLSFTLCRKVAATSGQAVALAQTRRAAPALLRAQHTPHVTESAIALAGAFQLVGKDIVTLTVWLDKFGSSSACKDVVGTF